jgi:uncharacterized protein YcfJ
MFKEIAMKKAGIFIGFVLISASALSQYSGGVEIVRIDPRMVTTYQQQCREVAVQSAPSQGNSASGVLGALAGAAIGNQIGGGSGRDIATAAGAVIGYQMGRGELQPGGVTYRTVCESVPVTVQRGETVTFRYRGRLFSQTFD